MSRLQRNTLLVGAFIVLALLGASVVVQRPAVQSSIHRWCENNVSNSWEGAVKFGSLKTSILPPTAKATDIEIYRHSSDDSPWLKVQSASLRLRPWLSFRGNIIINDIKISGLSGVIDLQDPLFEKSDGTPRNAPPIEFESISLDSSSLDLHQKDSSLEIKRIQVTITPLQKSHLATLTIADTTLSHPTGTYPVSTRAKATIHGSLLAPESIEFLPTSINLNSIATSLNGKVNFDTSPTLDLKVDFDGTLEPIRNLHPKLQLWDGHVTASLKVQGSLKNPSVSTTASFDDLFFKENKLPDIQLRANYQDSLITFDTISLQSDLHGALQLSGTTRLEAGFATQFDARLNNVVLEQTLESLGIKNPWIRSPVSGDISAHGMLSPFKLDGTANLDFQYFQGIVGGYRNNRGTKLVHLKESRLSTRFKIDATRLAISDARLRRGRSELSLAGSFFMDRKKGMQLNLSSSQFNLLDLGLISGVPFRGKGSIAATVEGPYRDPTISTTAELAGFQIQKYFLGTTKATMIYSDIVLDIPRVSIKRGNGSAEGRVTLNFRKKGIHTAGVFDLTKVPAGPLLDLVILDTPNSKRFAGLVDGRLVFEGPLLHPAGIARLKSPGVLIDQSDLGPARMVCRFGETDSIVALNLNLKPGKGTISAFYSLDPNGEMTLKTAFNEVPIPSLTPMMGNIPVTGQLSGTSLHKGPRTSLNGKLSFKATNLRAFGVKLETTALVGITQNGASDISGTALSGDAGIIGKLIFEEKLPFTATTTFKDLELNRTRLVPKGMVAISTGSIFSQGSLLKANKIMADTRLENLMVKVNQTVLKSKHPVRILYANQGFDFQDVRLSGDDMAFNVKGRASFTAPLDVNVDSQGPLQSLNGMLSRGEFTRGMFNLKLTLEGHWGSPRYTGFFTAKDGAAEFSEIRVSGIDTRINFEGNTIRIESGHAKIGDGITQFGGNVLLNPAKPAQVNINATLDRVRLTPLRDLETTLTGNLNLVGKSDNLSLRGDVNLESLLYTANLELQQLIRKRETPFRVPAFSPGKSWALHIDVNADDNLLIANNLLEAEFKAGLRVTGTTEHIGLVGSVTPLWAKATYAGNSYNIDRAILDFTDEYRIFSQFDVLASTQACGMELKVSITGNSERYIVEASGKDEDGVVDSQDALLCAQFGVRLQNYAKEDGSGLRDTLPGAVDALWKVSGMDERVRRFLPVVDQLRLTSGYSKSSSRVEPRVLLSKSLGKDWELKYNGPLYYKDEQHVISLEYRLTPTTTLESTWVSVSEASIGDLGLDLRLQWEFE